MDTPAVKVQVQGPLLEDLLGHNHGKNSALTRRVSAGRSRNLKHPF